jgi:hypothetical protein
MGLVGLGMVVETLLGRTAALWAQQWERQLDYPLAAASSQLLLLLLPAASPAREQMAP